MSPSCYILVLLLHLVALHIPSASASSASSASPSRPNIVILFADNLAYEDVGAFRTTTTTRSTTSSSDEEPSPTPYLDEYISTSRKFLNWNSPAVLCSASRAALLTGRYPVRTGVFPRVFEQDAKFGLPQEEVTLAEFLKEQNYSTKIVGKWHLGQREEYLPTGQGFDEWFGIPYHMSGGSVDGFGVCGKDTNGTMWLPLYEGSKIVEQPVKLQQLAPRYVNESIHFIQENLDAKRPFFLYLAFSHVHQLCAPRIHECQWASTHFSRDQHSWNATFGDAVREMDWIAGQVLDALDDNNTLTIFTSDNGPWVAEQSCAGRKGPFQAKWLQDNVPRDCTACPSEYVPDPLPDRPWRCVYPRPDNALYEADGIPCGEDSGLGSAFEANVRMPAFARWPGKIEGGTESWDLMTTLDVVPTILSILGQPIPDNIDGVDATNVLLSQPHSSNDINRSIFFWRDGFPEGPLPPPFGRFDVVAIKMMGGRYKLFFSTKSSHYNDDKPQYHSPPLIFDVLDDPAESKPLDPAKYQDLIAQAYRELEAHKKSVDWENVNPLCLARDSKYIPCVDAATKCRTHDMDSTDDTLLNIQ